MPLPMKSEGDPHVAGHNEERAAINQLEEDVAARIIKPPNPAVGSILRWDGSNWVLAPIRLFFGTGSPEGSIAAPIGSRYVDTTPDSGAVEWIKRTGLSTDNTGWILSVYADTGWRNVSASLSMRSNGIVHSAQIRRTNDVVDVYFDLTMPTNETAPFNFYDFPLGFRPSFSRYGALQDNKEGATTSTQVETDGSANLFGLVGGKRDRYNGSWTTDDPWPAVLPGV